MLLEVEQVLFVLPISIHTQQYLQSFIALWLSTHRELYIQIYVYESFFPTKINEKNILESTHLYWKVSIIYYANATIELIQILCTV